MTYYFNILKNDGNIERIYAPIETEDPKTLFDTAQILCQQKHVDSCEVRELLKASENSKRIIMYIKLRDGRIYKKP